MEFYFLRQDLFGDATGIEIEGHTELSAQFDWIEGIKFDRPFPGDTFMLDDAYGSNYPDFFDTSIPVMSSRLVDALVAAGVSNLDSYPVVLRNPGDGTERADYLAVNIIGRVDAIDLSRSPHELQRGKPEFNGAMIIDSQRTAGLMAFRLPYGPGFIVVAESVTQRLRKLSLDSVLLQPTRDYDGD